MVCYTAKAKLFREPDTPIEGVKQVNEAVEELLRINYDQFKQISMIAQGEFREVLYADTKKRGEILQKIFATEGYRKMAFLMDNRRKEAQGQMLDTLKSIEQYFAGIQYDMDSEYAAEIEGLKGTQYQIDEKVTVFEKIIEGDAEKISQKEIELEEKRKNAAEKEKDYTLIHATNQLFHTYETLEQQKNSLEEQKEAMLQTEALVQKQKKAVYEVLPLKEALEEVSHAKVKVEQTVKVETEALDRAKKSVVLETEALKHAEESKGIAQAKEKEALLIAESEEKYRKREELRISKAELEKKKETLLKQKEDLIANRTAIELAITSGKSRVEELAKSPELYVTVQQICEKLEERKAALTKISKEKLPALVKQKRELEKLQDVFAKKRASYDVLLE